MAIVATQPYIVTTLGSTPLAGNVAIAAAGRSQGIVGYCRLEGGSGSKTISSSGGKIYWVGASSTFANAGTNWRVGVQDVSLSNGLENGTYDVYGDVAGGSGAIPATAANIAMTMTGGTKTIANGDLIAIVAEMTTRGGTDTVTVTRHSNNALSIGQPFFPYGTTDISTLSKNQSPLWAMLVFDDATIGWIDGLPYRALQSASLGTVAYNSGSTPDEYIGTFILPMTVQISGIGATIGSIATTDNFDLVLYSDPYGTPTIIQTLTHDPDLAGDATTPAYPILLPVTPVTLIGGSPYGIAVRPTTTNSINYYYYDHTSGFEAIKRASLFGANAKVASRTDQTGAFTEVQTYYQPAIILEITGFDVTPVVMSMPSVP